ncbi:MAG: hypothetical protein E7163_03205 [Firmicutes bacterium]|nr:hypothetical protein [Bacillota bacterium]
MGLFKKSNNKTNDKLSLAELYIGQLGVVKSSSKEGMVDWIGLKNSFIAFTKHQADSEHNFNDYGLDIFSGTGYNFFKNFYGGYINGNIYVYNCRPLSIFASEDEIKNGIISKERVLDILSNINIYKDNENKYNGDEIINLILDAIEKIKISNIMYENKDIYLASLTELATYYVSKLIEIKSKDYSLESTSNSLIKELKQEVINKLNTINNMDNGLNNSNSFSRTLEKK